MSILPGLAQFRGYQRDWLRGDVVAGLVRLGFLADLLSHPVLIGYMTGVALIMIASQLGKVTGVSVEGEEFIDQIRSFVGGIDELHWPTVTLAVAVLVVLLVFAWLTPRLPGPLIAILVAALVVSVSRWTALE
jgi:sulfate permease, SulP family